MTTHDLYKIFLLFPSVQTDTRKIKTGDIFFALKGPNYNGNLFAAKALELGASYCVCDELSGNKDDRIIIVNDVTETLQQLSKYHREQFNIPFIAITGSNGKTTTKELVHAVLSRKFKCYTTSGNLNNHIGIPLTILSVKKDAEIAVIEMGANHLREIEGYCKYALPTHGLITNCGKAHLEGFGSEEGVRKGKGELYDFIATAEGIIFLNTDYDYLSQMSASVKNKITYGSELGDYTGKAIQSEYLLEVEITKGADIGTIKTKLAGNYNLPNVMSAVCIGKTFGVTDDQIKAALENYIPSNSRSQIIKSGSNTVILDAYNANPSSMAAAIENFAAMDSNKKILVLGGMMELGEDSIKEHRDIIDLIKKNNWYKVAVAGKDYADVPEDILKFNSAEETAVWFRQENFENAFILVKGSRGMQMEKILE